jgi:hypothetical protein
MPAAGESLVQEQSQIGWIALRGQGSQAVQVTDGRQHDMNMDGNQVTGGRLMKKTSAILTVCAGLLLAALPVVAHHSFAAEFDADKPITVKGTVTKMDWVNPHSHLLFDVKGDDGNMEHWSAECLPPNGLYRQGWRKDSVKPGDEVTVVGFKAKDGSFYMWAQSVTTGDGKRLFSGQPQDRGATGPGEGPGAAPKQ